LSSAVVVDDSSSSSELFIDLDGTNVGFQHWHPTPVTAMGDRLAGQSELGGVWEWTSTPLRKFEGFEPLSLYPGYTGKFPDSIADKIERSYEARLVARNKRGN
jgi:formylglycine-generating enzyme required for sulfatase activity